MTSSPSSWPARRRPNPGRDPEQLAALAAQLCHQSLAWDARTRHPFPLHVAGAMDRAHPEYRSPSIEPSSTSSALTARTCSPTASTAPGTSPSTSLPPLPPTCRACRHSLIVMLAAGWAVRYLDRRDTALRPTLPSPHSTSPARRASWKRTGGC
ncbi:RNaseH domain-containing protein [Streptomyces sp. NPDC006662]|uniref:RNaseH domain-containing protein n=1 Tax=Streptomyces sp. NPDC006662 TaxID=3156902 RepID=UPI0033C5C35B